MANLNPALAEDMGLAGADGGVVITAIKHGTVAHRLQFQPGDIILKINGRPVATVAALKSALRGAEGWTVSIRREGEVLTVTVGG